MYMVDTCIFIEFLRGRLPALRRKMERDDPSLYKVPTIVEAELLYGVEHGGNDPANRLRTNRIIAPYEKVPFDSACASAYAKTRQYLAERGMTIGPNDLLIAATALAHEATLITKNVGEFSRVPGLRVEDWDA